jgi:hypothetical protein
MLSHNVFFSLKDRSPPQAAHLVAECKKHLSAHPGTVFFACGTLEPELARPVNDRDFDVALHVVFDGRPAHDAYQTAAAHEEFIRRNRDNWARVRVFDSLVEGAP